MSSVELHAPLHKYPFLPPELAPIILSQAPDAPTLRNLVHSASCFYNGFFAEERRILQAVLLNEYGLAVLPEALATYRALRLPQVDFEAARDEFLAGLEGSCQIPEDWHLLDSLALSKIYSDVEWFTLEFAETLRRPCEQNGVRPTELDRIRRALFRFELYRHLFPKDHFRPSPEERRELFFDKFSPWENEQLTMIYEFLYRRLSIAFDDVAKHDVLWAKHRIRYDECRMLNVFKEHCLSRGLVWLRKAAMANTYDDRYQLLALETGEQDPDFLFRPLYDVYDVEKDLIMLDDFTEGAICQHVESSFVEDPDPGPFTAWLWAHKNQSTAYTYATGETRQLRAEGYVAMDYDRLRKRYDLGTPFEPVLGPVAQLSAADEQESNCRLHERDESYRRRCEIYDAGGRGYWSGDDGSKLIWGNTAPGAGMEMTLDPRTEPYRDTWKEGILVDRIRLDHYIVS